MVLSQPAEDLKHFSLLTIEKNIQLLSGNEILSMKLKIVDHTFRWSASVQIRRKFVQVILINNFWSFDRISVDYQFLY